VHELLGGQGIWSAAPEIAEVKDLDDDSPYPIITGDYTKQLAIWGSIPIEAGTPLAAPKPVFKKLDSNIVDEELARLETGTPPDESE